MANILTLAVPILPTTVLSVFLFTACMSHKNSMLTQLTPLTPDRTISIHGVNINYTANIRSNGRPTVVLIHGFGASLETWNDIYPLLCESYSVIRMDLKGCGFSDKPKDDQYTTSDQARLLVEFLAELKQTHVVLVGHSLGGGVALLTYFESKVKTQGIDVRGLVLSDSAGYSQDLPFFVSAVRNPIMRLFSNLMPAGCKARFVLNRIFEVKDQVTPDRVHRYAFFLDRPGSRYALHQTAKQIVPQNVSELVAQFSTVTIPTLILWGENDRVIPMENARRFNQDIPNSQLVVLRGTGHIPHEERPAETFAAIDQFLKALK